jgi:histidinol-phosphatase (PHP family)
MERSSIHTHTSFCDGTGSVEDFCRAAFEKGFVSLGFSAHAPAAKKTGVTTNWHLPEEKLEEYLDTVRAAKRRWAGKLDVYLGLEVDYISGIMGPADKDYRKMGLDYIIGSAHYITPPNALPFTVDGPADELEAGLNKGFGGDREGLVNAYWDAVEEMINSGGFDVLGHPDLIKKNNAGEKLFSPSAAFYQKRLRRIAALAGHSGLVAEINTGGMNRQKTPDPYPSLPLLRLFFENNVPMTINSDAHRPEDLHGHYPDAVRALLDAGYTEAVLFAGGTNGKAQWKNEQLAKRAR